MVKKESTRRAATSAEIQQAMKALGVTIPVRAGEWKGEQLILHTRSGDYAWTPPAAKAARGKGRSSE